MIPEIIEGDILQQNVEVIVNAWNRNIFPWWLLLPQGVSGAIKRKAGLDPFRELSGMGLIELGGARLTGAGKLPFKAIIHVAGINLFWFATDFSVRQSVRSAMQIVADKGFASVAFPLIGSGSGNRGKEWSKQIMLEEFASLSSNATVKLVVFRE
ncbi:MAG: Appr-1-p processing protein [Candidatus Riflebacteria bacterium HGW-Riflebacteria-2]|jgi:O-acetyl-ADP-ribose deacetylase (regulator of RNase III)|nr:MAG: Appr-1-p processing protein [Candidatus Riflebacteria bacterium HGW-Riflebacteria-2]